MVAQEGNLQPVNEMKRNDGLIVHDIFQISPSGFRRELLEPL